MNVQMVPKGAALSFVLAVLGAGACPAGNPPKSIDIVVQGTMKVVLQAPSGVRDSSWSSQRRIPSCSVLGLRNTATGTPMVHISVSDCRPGEYIVDVVSVGRALGITVMADGPDWQCGRGDGIKAPDSGESCSWVIAFPDSARSDCRLVLRRLDGRRQNR